MKARKNMEKVKPRNLLEGAPSLGGVPKNREAVFPAYNRKKARRQYTSCLCPPIRI